MRFWPVYLLCVIAFFVWDGWQSHLKESRVIEQGKLLASIEALHTPGTSHFVDVWRRSHPEPLAGTLSDLAIVAADLENDPSKADALAQRIEPDATWSDELRTAIGWLNAQTRRPEILAGAALLSIVITGLLLFTIFKRGREDS